MQNKKQSLIEALMNVLIGSLIFFVSLFIIFPILGIESNAEKNSILSIYFTSLSILRNYLLRRYFNKKHKVKE